MPLKRKDLLGIADLSPEEINFILDTAETFRDINQRQIKKVPTLRGKTVINLFFEASTRTRTSFEIAAKRLSADAINISASTSSVVKGETLVDTALNLQAMAPDAIVIRHSSSGAPHQIAKIVDAAVINAGKFLQVQAEFGRFDKYIWRFVDGKPIVNRFKSLKDYPAISRESDALSKDLKQRGFKFVGSTIIYAHMQATGMVNDHAVNCFRRQAIVKEHG